MTELERRIEHNKQALAAVASERKRMYGGAIIDVEMEPECLSGKAVLAVTDDVFNRLPKEAQYTPHIHTPLDKNGQPVQLPKGSTPVTADLNLLLG